MGLFKKISVKRKIMIAFSLGMLVLFAALCALFFRMASSYATDMSRRSLMQTTSILQERTEDLYHSYNNQTVMLYHMNSINYLGNKEKEQQHYDDIVRDIASIFDTSKGAFSIYLQTENNQYYRGTQIQNIDEHIKTNISKVRERSGRLAWLSVTELHPYSGKKTQYFVMSRIIYSKELNEVASLWLIVQPTVLNDIFAKTSFIDGAQVFLSNRDNSMFYPDNVANDQAEKALYSIPDNERSGGFETQKLLVVYRKSYDTQWSCVSVAPKSQIFNHLRVIVLYFAIFMVFCILLIIILFKLLNHIVFLPLNDMVRGVDNVAQGDLTTQIPQQYVDEMGILANHFNIMVLRVSSLLTEVKQQEAEKNNYRMQSLMMQMSPHFIYNTLNTIKWIAVINKQNQIAKLIDSLIQIFKNMTNKTDDNNTVKDEIAFLESYIHIQRARYTSFNVSFEMQDGVESLSIKRFLLQPIVENAIIHGVKDKPDSEIKIAIYRENQNLYIDVIDNGAGFDMNSDNKNKSETESKKRNHIGIENVVQMIKLEHGDEYGLIINSSPGSGTHVKYTLPVIENHSGDGGEKL